MSCLKSSVLFSILIIFCNAAISAPLGYLYLSRSDFPAHHADRDIEIFSADFLGIGQDGVVYVSRNAQKFSARYRSGITNSDHWSGTSNLVDWTIRQDDLYVIGDFDGDGKDDILAANPNGIYSAYKYLPTIATNVQARFSRYLYKTNGDIQANDKLVSGDFTGNGQDEVLLVKPDGRYYTMQYHQWTNSNGNHFNEFDILEAGNSPMHWWNISANDQYIVGDYNGDGKDDVMAINPNGWAHVMSFNNGHWQYYSGVSNGVIGGANIGQHDHYTSGDFNGDGKDEIILTNPNHPWALALRLVANQWQSYNHNNGSNNLARPNRPYYLAANTQMISGNFFNSNGNKDSMLLYDFDFQFSWHILNLY